jgi:hypothetical protein
MKNKKETQGSRKLKQRIEDLLRNESFLRELKELGTKYHKDKLSGLDFMISSDHLSKIDSEIKKIGELHNKSCQKINNTLNKLAEVFGIEKIDHLFHIIHILQDKNRKCILEELLSNRLEMCRIIDAYDECYHGLYPPIPIQIDVKKQTLIRACPVVLYINKFASQRDVVDFIENNWKRIKKIQNNYADKGLNIRQRKKSRQLLDFIWENRKLSSKKIKAVLDEKFPHNGLVYNEILDLKRGEKKRRKQNLM